MLMAVAMIAAVMLAFPAPANAFNYYVYELNEFQPYLDHCLYGFDAYFEDVQEIVVQVTFG